MSHIKLAYTLQYSPDYVGDRHPWHWYSGTTFDNLARTSAHTSESEALTFLCERLSSMARQKREPVEH